MKSPMFVRKKMQTVYGVFLCCMAPGKLEKSAPTVLGGLGHVVSRGLWS